MVIKSVYFVPHGGVMVPGLEKEYNEDARILHEAMEKIQKEIKEDGIKLIFLTNPHGYSHPTDYLVYLHQIFEGYQIFYDEEKASIKQYVWPGNIQVAQLLIQMLRETGIPATPFIQADINYPLKLAWGETIPLSYFSGSEGPQVVIFGTPLNSSKERKDELLEIGKFLKLLGDAPVLENTPISIIISGDLSHKHDPNHEYGFHENSKIYDEMAVDWTKNPTNEKLDQLLELNETADGCGTFGMGILQGLFNFSADKKWSNSMSTYACPTYFGMIVSGWKL
ncbi:MAG: DODA-type extradiol aromatic ring-opening family dioxygenase [Candidatus Kariarchaeaceae archaeon]|jgi:aromatic ring-opening dioxygenase LigB subunit